MIKQKGSINHRSIHFIDFLATFVDITSANYPKRFRGEDIVPLQGESFLSSFKGKDEKRKKPIFWQWAKGKAVRKGDWKLVRHQGPWELYNLKNDRTEVNNVAQSYPEKVQEMERMYLDWYKSVSD